MLKNNLNSNDSDFYRNAFGFKETLYQSFIYKTYYLNFMEIMWIVYIR